MNQDQQPVTEVPTNNEVDKKPPTKKTKKKKEENEISEFVGITLYDMNRKPRESYTDNTKKTISIRDINRELTCPVCLGILHETQTVMQCLHRFCSECIMASLRLGNKECPSCRIPVSSRRNLRPDKNFDALISALFPNLAEIEAQEDTKIEKITNDYKTNIVQPMGESLRRQNKRTKDIDNGKSSKRTKSEKESEKKVPTKLVPSPKQTKTQKTKQSPTNEEPEEISFVLSRHPLEKFFKELKKKYLRTSRKVTIRHLNKFLSKKLDISDPNIFKITILKNGQGLVALDDELTLHQIEKELWNSQEDLVLHYFCVNSVKQEVNEAIEKAINESDNE